MHRKKIIDRLHGLGIEELKSVTTLNDLNGDYINLDCRWPNGATGKILDDNRRYYAIQVEREGSDRCYGVAADENQIAVFTYGCGGKDAELVMWLKL
jgi:hypothetical protein